MGVWQPFKALNAHRFLELHMRRGNQKAPAKSTMPDAQEAMYTPTTKPYPDQPKPFFPCDASMNSTQVFEQ